VPVCLDKLGTDQHVVWLLIQYYDDVAVCLRGIILAALAPAYAARNSRQVLPPATHSPTCFAQHRQRPGLRFLATPCHLCVLSVTVHCLDTTHVLFASVCLSCACSGASCGSVQLPVLSYSFFLHGICFVQHTLLVVSCAPS